MSHYRRHSLEPSITGKYRDSLTFRRDDDVIDKPDFRELGSPLRPRRSSSSAATTPAASGSSSSSSGSASGKPSVTSQLARRSHSGELSGLTSSVTPGSATKNRNPKPGHRRSASAGTPLIYSGLGFSPMTNHNSRGGGSGATSPNPGVLPTGNICPSGRILKTGMATRTTVKPETLCTGAANYGHGNIVRSGGINAGKTIQTAREIGDSEEVKKAGNEMYRKGNFVEALAFYDRAISMSPENPAYRSNRAAALAASGRLEEAVKECIEALRFDPCYVRAHQRLASLYLRLESNPISCD